MGRKHPCLTEHTKKTEMFAGPHSDEIHKRPKKPVFSKGFKSCLAYHWPKTREFLIWCVLRMLSGEHQNSHFCDPLNVSVHLG